MRMEIRFYNLIICLTGCVLSLGGSVLEDHVENLPELYFTKLPLQEVTVIRGAPQKLECEANGDKSLRQIKIEWYKNGELLPDQDAYDSQPMASHVSLLHNKDEASASIFFPSFDKHNDGVTDKGSYQCMAINHLGTITSHVFELDFAYLHPFSEGPEDTSTYIGHAARFHCDIEGSPQPTITWEKDKIKILDQQNGYTILPSGVLQLNNVSYDDEGSYRCYAENKYRQRLSKQGSLTIKEEDEGNTTEPVYYLAAPQNLTVVKGESALFECLTTGTSSQVSWIHSEHPVDLLGRFRVIGKSNLQIHRVRPSDAGTYNCMVDDTHLQASADLIVLESPKSVKVSPSIVLCERGENITLHCQHHGHPSPSITWYRNGKKVLPDKHTKLHGHSLLLTVHKEFASTIFQCFAQNSAGILSHMMHLKVAPEYDAPLPPKIVKIETVGNRMIRLDWRMEPEDRENIIAYTVHYWTGDEPEAQKVVSDSQWWCVVEHLRPYSRYNFYMQAFSRHKDSPNSHLVSIVTQEEVPIGNPMVKAMTLGPTALQLSWNQLPLSLARGLINKYKIMYKEHDSANLFEIIMKGNFTNYVISGLLCGREYDVSVLAGNSKGFPELDETMWPWVRQSTAPVPSPDSPPDPPMLNSKALNASSVLVTWHYPKSSEVTIMPTSYNLTYWPSPLPPSNVTTLSPIPHNHHGYHSRVIENLEPDHLYYISIVAKNEHGDKGPIVRTISTLPVSSQLAANELKAESVNESTVVISILRGVVADGETYRVSYRPLHHEGFIFDSDSPPEPHVVHSIKNQLWIGELNPFTEYEFSISMTERTTQVRCRTNEGVPSPPQNICYTEHTPGVIVLRWTPPAHTNGVIIAYIIKYRRADPDLTWDIIRENGTVTHTMVDHLELDTTYFFQMEAATRAGVGPPTKQFPLRTTPSGMDNAEKQWNLIGQQGMSEERQMGIIIGSCIGGTCIVICIILVLLRNRCCPPSNSPPAGQHSLCPLYSNGTRHPASHVHCSCGHSYEMDRLLPHIQQYRFEQSNGNGRNGRIPVEVMYLPHGGVKTILCTPHKSGTNGKKESILNGDGVSYCSLDDIDYGPEEQPDKLSPCEACLGGQPYCEDKCTCPYQDSGFQPIADSADVPSNRMSAPPDVVNDKIEQHDEVEPLITTQVCPTANLPCRSTQLYTSPPTSHLPPFSDTSSSPPSSADQSQKNSTPSEDSAYTPLQHNQISTFNA